MATIRKLAELAGVSIGTVSMALRDNPRVHVKTRERIQALATEFHYRPNRLMQSLVTGSSYTLGCLLPFVDFPYCSCILRGVLEEAFLASYHLFVLETHGQESHTILGIQALVEQRVDGIIIHSGHQRPIPRKSILELRSHNIIPIILDATLADLPVDQVRTQEQQLAQLAVNYLCQLGHRRLAYIGPAAKGHLHGRALAIGQELQKRLLPPAAFFDTGDQTFEKLTDGRILQELLDLPTPPTAIITTDDMAVVLLRQLGQHGMVVPRDISILGIGNHPMSAFMSPPLTSIAQNPEEVGRQAMYLLLKRIAEGIDYDAFQPESLFVTPQLMLRESCAPARTVTHR